MQQTATTTAVAAAATGCHTLISLSSFVSAEPSLSLLLLRDDCSMIARAENLARMDLNKSDLTGPHLKTRNTGVGIYELVVAAQIGRPRARRVKQETDLKRTGFSNRVVWESARHIYARALVNHKKRKTDLCFSFSLGGG